MSEQLVGRRVYYAQDQPLCKQEGDYGQDQQGLWWVWPPRCSGPSCLTINLPNRNWKVTEHEDKTISATPSINCIGVWHGYLNHGIWQEC